MIILFLLKKSPDAFYIFILINIENLIYFIILKWKKKLYLKYFASVVLTLYECPLLTNQITFTLLSFLTLLLKGLLKHNV